MKKTRHLLVIFASATAFGQVQPTPINPHITYFPTPTPLPTSSLTTSPSPSASPTPTGCPIGYTCTPIHTGIAR